MTSVNASSSVNTTASISAMSSSSAQQGVINQINVKIEIGKALVEALNEDTKSLEALTSQVNKLNSQRPTEPEKQAAFDASVAALMAQVTAVMASINDKMEKLACNSQDIERLRTIDLPAAENVDEAQRRQAEDASKQQLDSARQINVAVADTYGESAKAARRLTGGSTNSLTGASGGSLASGGLPMDLNLEPPPTTEKEDTKSGVGNTSKT